jgi:signal peptidase I
MFKIKSPIKGKQEKDTSIKRILKEVGLFTVDILYNAVIIIVLVILIRTYLISPFRVVGSSMADTLHSNEFILIDKLSYRLNEPERGDPVVFKPPITNKYPQKFEEVVATDENGQGVLDFEDLTTNKNVIYCQNKITKSFWFCKEKVQEGDIVFYRLINNNTAPRLDINWKTYEKANITAEELKNQKLTINGEPNESYLVRIYSESGPEYFVKRIIGIPGDVIKIDNGRVYLKTAESTDFVELDEGYLNAENKNNTYFSQNMESNTITVPEGYYFVLGDNRNHSNDSRSWFSPIDQEYAPFVSKENLNGKVLVVLWPLNGIRFIPGQDL